LALDIDFFDLQISVEYEDIGIGPYLQVAPLGKAQISSGDGGGGPHRLAEAVAPIHQIANGLLGGEHAPGQCLAVLEVDPVKP